MCSALCLFDASELLELATRKHKLQLHLGLLLARYRMVDSLAPLNSPPTNHVESIPTSPLKS